MKEGHNKMDDLEFDGNMYSVMVKKINSKLLSTNIVSLLQYFMLNRISQNVYWGEEYIRTNNFVFIMKTGRVIYKYIYIYI